MKYLGYSTYWLYVTRHATLHIRRYTLHIFHPNSNHPNTFHTVGASGVMAQINIQISLLVTSWILKQAQQQHAYSSATQEQTSPTVGADKRYTRDLTYHHHCHTLKSLSQCVLTQCISIFQSGKQVRQVRRHPHHFFLSSSQQSDLMTPSAALCSFSFSPALEEWGREWEPESFVLIFWEKSTCKAPSGELSAAVSLPGLELPPLCTHQQVRLTLHLRQADLEHRNTEEGYFFVVHFWFDDNTFMGTSESNK